MATILFDGVAYGMLLFVLACGLAVTLGLMNFVNLAHGAFAMAGGYLVLTAMRDWNVPFFLALLLTFLIVGAVSVVFERMFYARLYKATELDQVLLTIGLAFMAIAAYTWLYGPRPQTIQLPDYLTGQVDIASRTFPTYRVFIIVFSFLIIVGLWFGVERTRWGAMVRAAVDHRAMAQSVGINTRLLFMLTFALGSGLAGLGGALGADILPVQWAYPFEHLVYFLIVVAVGGLGSLRGPFIAALLIGVADTACKYWTPEFGAFLVYAATIGILLWRPQGLFGVRT